MILYNRGLQNCRPQTESEFSPLLEQHPTLLVFWLFGYTIVSYNYINGGTAVAQWLRCCATNRKVAGSIAADVSGFFINIKSFRSHYGPGVDSSLTEMSTKEYFLGVKAAGA